MPCVIRWPGVIKPGTINNDIFSHEDMLPTLLAAAGDADVKDKLLKGMDVGGKSYKVHLDGYNQLPYLIGQAEKSPRRGFFYFNDDGDIVAVRIENWKIVFMEQRAPGTLGVWSEPFTPLRLPKMFDLHADPYEQADITSNTYYQWEVEQGYILLAGSTLTGEFLKTFKDFPPANGRPHSPSTRRWKG